MRHVARTARLAGRQAMARAFSETKKPAKLWGGAFGEATDKTMELFNDSLPFDKRLWAADLAGSKAYAAALTEAGVIDQDQSTKMRQGLSDVRKEWASGNFVEIEGDEDIHTANERRLGDLVGTAKKIFLLQGPVDAPPVAARLPRRSNAPRDGVVPRTRGLRKSTPHCKSR